MTTASNLGVRGRLPLLVTGVAVLAGLAVRIRLAGLPVGYFDGDEATTGLMVRQILHGHLYVYMAGQNYNGALEQYLQAAVWAVLPQTVDTLRSVEFALFVVTALVVYRLGVAMFTSAWRATVAVGVFALGPYFNVWKSIHSHGGYASGQLAAACALWAAIGLQGDRSDSRKRLLALGFSVGLTAWLSLPALIVAIPAAAWVIPSLRSAPRKLVVALGGFMVGAAPAIGYLIAHPLLPGDGGLQRPSTTSQRLHGLFGPILREFLGIGYRYGKPGLPSGWQLAAVVLVVVAVGAGIVARARPLLATLVGRRDRRRPTDVLLLVPPVLVVAYARSGFAWWTGEPRYLFAVFPVLALGVAAILPTRRALLAGGPVVVALATVSTLTTIASHGDDGPRDETSCLSSVVTQLTALHVTTMYSDYWTGMPLQMAAGSRLVVAPAGGGRGKFPELRTIVDADPNIAYLAGHLPDPMDKQGDDVTLVRDQLAHYHVRAKQTDLGCAVLFTDFTPAVRPWQVGLGEPIAEPSGFADAGRLP